MCKLGYTNIILELNLKYIHTEIGKYVSKKLDLNIKFRIENTIFKKKKSVIVRCYY